MAPKRLAITDSGFKDDCNTQIHKSPQKKEVSLGNLVGIFESLIRAFLWSGMGREGKNHVNLQMLDPGLASFPYTKLPVPPSEFQMPTYSGTIIETT